MTKHKNRRRRDRSGWAIVFGLVSLGAILAVLLRGKDITLFNSKGLIAQQEQNLMLFTILLLLTVAVPTLIILYSFARHYRESNDKAVYDPHTHHGKLFSFTIWAIPSTFMLILALVMWPATHRLQPIKAISPETKPLTIQVVAMRWKWLFIYPDQHIASLNYVQVPVDRPVRFELTADDAPMSSFWIPHLSGQLYAMTGHTNRLNVMAEAVGDYPGRSAEINGAGFADMKFTARVSSEADFNSWVQSVKQSPDKLDTATYDTVVKPSENNPAVFYSSYEAGLYDKVLMKYMEPGEGHAHHE